MSDWRELQCGKVALRSALEGGQTPAGLPPLHTLSEQMSCGGMYIPDWQSRFMGHVRAPATLRVPVIHLQGESDIPSFLLIQSATSDRRDETAPTSEAAAMNPEYAQNRSALLLDDLKAWWNKN